MKQCTKCKQFFPATKEFFHANHTQSSGFHPQCKICRSKERKERYEINGELERAQMRDYAKNHSKKAVERMREWKINNPKKLAEHNHKYHMNHKEQGRVNVTNRQARLAKAQGKHTAGDVLRLFKEQGGKCAYCGIELIEKYHVDHIIPISRGGSNYPSNLAISCQFCNESKGAKLLEEWIR
jgi:5-methylcytosine-specific restriction endonuclease McrA